MITGINVPSLQVGTFDDQFIGGKISVADFTDSLARLDVSDPISCQAVVVRCNNRCNGGTILAAVEFVATTGTPKKGDPTESFQVQFTIS